MLQWRIGLEAAGRRRYFEDPEKNLIEVYWVTGWSTPDTYVEPINFELSEAQLHLEVEHLAAKSRVRRL
jgi:hypothetical protein